jgi:DinB superfamily
VGEEPATERVKLKAERDMLRVADPDGLAGAWAMIEGIWSRTVARASEMPEPVLHEQVDGEWSFVQTQRHLVLVTDCWLRRMVKGIAHPYHPWGLAGSWLSRPRRWGIDPEADPRLDQVLDVRRERIGEVRDAIAAVKAEDLGRNCVPPPDPGHPRKDHTVLQCLHVVLKEEWHHHRYSVRDLEVLENRHG